MVETAFDICWHHKDMPLETFSTRDIEEDLVMILGTISFQGRMELQIIQGRQIATGYVGLLEGSSLFIKGPRLCRNDWIFRGDKATTHNASSTKNFFHGK